MMKTIFAFLLLASLVQAQGSEKALSFDGNDYVSLPLFSTLNGQQQLTISSWYYHDGSTSFETVFAHWAGNCSMPIGANVGVLFVIANDRVSVAFQSGKVLRASSPLSAGQWYHITMVFDGTKANHADRVEIYVNGEAQGLDFASQDVPLPSAIGGLSTFSHIGLRRGCANEPLHYLVNKQIDELEVWSTALTRAELRHKMCESRTGSEPGLVAYYRMDEGVDNSCPGGQDVCDASGNGNHGIKQ